MRFAVEEGFVGGGERVARRNNEGSGMTIDLLGGCAPAEAGLSCGLQSRRALSAVAKGSLGSRPNKAF
jgi:hypothetical protein